MVKTSYSIVNLPRYANESGVMIISRALIIGVRNGEIKHGVSMDSVVLTAVENRILIKIIDSSCQLSIVF